MYNIHYEHFFLRLIQFFRSSFGLCFFNFVICQYFCGFFLLLFTFNFLVKKYACKTDILIKKFLIYLFYSLFGNSVSNIFFLHKIILKRLYHKKKFLWKYTNTFSKYILRCGASYVFLA